MLLGMVIAGTLGLWGLLRPDVAPGPSGSGPLVAQPATPQAAATESERVEREPLEPAGPEEAATPPRTFDAVYADILAVMLHTSSNRDEAAGNEDLRQQVGDLFAEMCTTIADAGPRSLQKVLGCAGDWSGPNHQVDINACRLILELRLKVMADAPDLVSSRRELVTSMIESMLVSRDVAQLVYDILRRRPYVEAVHESSLTALLGAASGELAFLHPMVLEMLLDLWLRMDDRNVDLLALVEGHGGVEAQRQALARLLLTDRYRDFALDRIKSMRDIRCMDDAALHAARHLDGPTAIKVVESLKATPEAELHPLGAYSILAERFPDLLEQSYIEALARGVLPAHRENAMQGLAFLPGDRWLELARRGFESDGAERVRGVCLLALAKLPTPEFGKVLDVALADPAFVSSVYGPSYLSGAVRNHAPRCTDVNFLDRATGSLLALLPSGSRQAREQIEGVRRQYVPQ
jgi:hypothetical protein